MKDVYRIVGGPEPHTIKVLAPDGTELPGVLEIRLFPITLSQGAKAMITVSAVSMELGVEAELEARARPTS